MDKWISLLKKVGRITGIKIFPLFLGKIPRVRKTYLIGPDARGGERGSKNKMHKLRSQWFSLSQSHPVGHWKIKIENFPSVFTFRQKRNTEAN